MLDHLRYAGLTPAAQHAVLTTIIRAEPVLMDVLQRMRALDLPDPLLGSGAIYNTVWNHLTGRPPLTGIKDFDVIYFDDRDLSWEAEDVVIQRSDAIFAGLPVQVEVRNQARVHLWFPQKFGTPYPQLKSSAEALANYASKTHAVAARLEADDSLTVVAPFGLEDMFAFRITPNHALDNRVTHETKAARAMSVWPELIVVPW